MLTAVMTDFHNTNCSASSALAGNTSDDATPEVRSHELNNIQYIIFTSEAST